MRKAREPGLDRVRRVLARLHRRRSARLGLVLLGLFLIAALLGPTVAPQDPIAQDLSRRLERPGPDHWLGTDEFGRDILSRLLYGTRISLSISSLFSSISTIRFSSLRRKTSVRPLKTSGLSPK